MVTSCQCTTERKFSFFNGVDERDELRVCPEMSESRIHEADCRKGFVSRKVIRLRDAKLLPNHFDLLYIETTLSSYVDAYLSLCVLLRLAFPWINVSDFNMFFWYGLNKS